MLCRGAGCAMCSGSGWIEILGSGMVDPRVFRACGIDPGRYTGFAFGCGLDRVALLKYGLPDLRLLFSGDERMLRQFGDGGASVKLSLPVDLRPPRGRGRRRHDGRAPHRLRG